MCVTCGCGIGQTRVNNKPIPASHRLNQPLRYRPHTPSPAVEHQTTKLTDTDRQPATFTTPETHIAFTHASDMNPTRIIKIERDILARNNHYATKNRRYLSDRGIFAINLVSSPGSGKTSLLVRTIQMLCDRLPIAVIEGDQQTDNDTARIRATGIPAIQINTGKGCHLDARMVSHAMQHLPLENNSLLFIENIGNLVCPSSFDLGEAHKVIVLSVTEGEDKPLKYPDMFHAADLMILNKCDLLPFLNFDVDLTIEYAHRINPALPVIQLSATQGNNMSAWLDWITTGCHNAASRNSSNSLRD